MTNGNNNKIAGHSRERKTNPQYLATLCQKYSGCKKEGRCKSRCSKTNILACYKAPEKVLK